MKTFPVLHLITLTALITVTSLSVIHTTAQSAARATIKGNRKASTETVRLDTATIQTQSIHIK